MKRRANWILPEVILHKNTKISIFQVCCVLWFIYESGILPLLSLCQSAWGVPGGRHTSPPCSKAGIICHSHECHGLGVLALCIKMQKQDRPLAAYCANKSKFLVKSLWHYWEKKSWVALFKSPVRHHISVWDSFPVAWRGIYCCISVCFVWGSAFWLIHSFITYQSAVTER